MDATGIDSPQTLHDHRKGEREFIDVCTAEKILNIFNQSSPLNEFGEPDDHINERYNSWGTRVELDDSIASFIFEPYDTIELAERADVETRNAANYKSGEANPTEDLFRECYNEVKRYMESRFNPEIDVLKSGSYSISDYSESIFIQDATHEDLSEINSAAKGFDRLEDVCPIGYTGIKEHSDKIDILLENLNDPVKGFYISSQELGSVGTITVGLKKLGAIEEFGNSSNYKITASKTYLEALNSLAT